MTMSFKQFRDWGAQRLNTPDQSRRATYICGRCGYKEEGKVGQFLLGTNPFTGGCPGCGASHDNAKIIVR